MAYQIPEEIVTNQLRINRCREKLRDYSTKDLLNIIEKEFQNKKSFRVNEQEYLPSLYSKTQIEFDSAIQVCEERLGKRGKRRMELYWDYLDRKYPDKTNIYNLLRSMKKKAKFDHTINWAYVRNQLTKRRKKIK